MLDSVAQFLSGVQQLSNTARRITGFEHSAEDAIWISPGSCFPRRPFVIHPGVDNDLLLGGESVEETVALVELGPKPIPIVLTERVSLSKLRCVWVAGDNLADIAIDRGKKLGRRLSLVAAWGLLCECLNLFDQANKLISKQWVRIQLPPIDDHLQDYLCTQIFIARTLDILHEGIDSGTKAFVEGNNLLRGVCDVLREKRKKRFH